MPGNNCATCAHGSTKPEDEPCRECTSSSSHDSYFPKWEAKKP